MCTGNLIAFYTQFFIIILGLATVVTHVVMNRECVGVINLTLVDSNGDLITSEYCGPDAGDCGRQMIDMFQTRGAAKVISQPANYSPDICGFDTYSIVLMTVFIVLLISQVVGNIYSSHYNNKK